MKIVTKIIHAILYYIYYLSYFSLVYYISLQMQPGVSPCFNIV